MTDLPSHLAVGRGCFRAASSCGGFVHLTARRPGVQKAPTIFACGIFVHLSPDRAGGTRRRCPKHPDNFCWVSKTPRRFLHGGATSCARVSSSTVFMASPPQRNWFTTESGQTSPWSHRAAVDEFPDCPTSSGTTTGEAGRRASMRVACGWALPGDLACGLNMQ